MPTPAPPSPPNPGTTVIHGVLIGLRDTASAHPRLVILVVALLIPGMVRSARIAMHDGPRDPVRSFSRADKARLLAYAGHQCEHHGIFGRCRATKDLEADHVHPHSRAGATHISNGQILCKPHNRTKTNHIPWNRSLRKLADSRAGYYPDDVDGVVVRRPDRRGTESGIAA